MTMPLPVGPLTPYVTPELLINAPTGISWSTIPPGRDVTPAQHTAEQLNICMRSTAWADSYCNQVLRATIDTEQVFGPDIRTTIENSTGMGRIILQRWPVLQIQAVQISPAGAFPRQFTKLPAGFWDIDRPVVGLFGTNIASAAGEGGQAIVIAPGYLNWALGRKGYVIQTTYVNGWPHTSLTAAVAIGASTLPVDDCTGWAPFTAGTSGATGVIYDSGSQEVLQCTASSATSGAGTITLQSPVQFAHAAGTMVSALPASIIQACILFSASQALTRGATSTTVHSIPGQGATSGTAGVSGPSSLAKQAELLLDPFRRVM